MRILVCPDSFKNTLSAVEVAKIIGHELQLNGHETELLPIADGGEGTVEVLLYDLNGEKKIVTVQNPLGRPVSAYYGLKNQTAFLEIAQAAGLNLLLPKEYNPLKTSTYGVGQMIKKSLDQGVKEILIGIGGSATNDCGIGMAQALGIKFLSKDYQELTILNGATLDKINAIDHSNLDPRLRNCQITVLSDVDNPLLGKNGASKTYARQKGGDNQMIEQLEKSMVHFSKILQNHYQANYNFSGAGAAGGLGAGLKIFLNAEIKSGIKGLAEILKLEEKIIKADLIIVGEGQIDWQTAFGKAPAGIAKIAQKFKKPVIAVVGKVGPKYQHLFKSLNIKHIFSCLGDKSVVNLPQLKKNAPLNLRKLAKIVAQTIPQLADHQYQLTLLP